MLWIFVRYEANIWRVKEMSLEWMSTLLYNINLKIVTGPPPTTTPIPVDLDQIYMKGK